MSNLIQDLRFALRVMKKAAGFTFVVILIQAVTVTTTAIVFTLAVSQLVPRLPFKNQERLVMIWANNPGLQMGTDEIMPDVPNYLDWRDQNTVFEKMAIYQRIYVNLVGNDSAE